MFTPITNIIANMCLSLNIMTEHYFFLSKSSAMTMRRACIKNPKHWFIEKTNIRDFNTYTQTCTFAPMLILFLFLVFQRLADLIFVLLF